MSPTNFLEFNVSSISLFKMKVAFSVVIVLEIQMVHSPVYYDFLNVDKLAYMTFSKTFEKAVSKDIGI
jgi:hypothetical protein